MCTVRKQVVMRLTGFCARMTCRREIDWARNRKERRKWRKQQEEVLDELLPKPTGGREARIEKKAARREARRASSPGQLMLSPGGDIMGGDDTLAEAKKRCSCQPISAVCAIFQALSLGVVTHPFHAHMYNVRGVAVLKVLWLLESPQPPVCQVKN